jgi:hypothetical protein
MQAGEATQQKGKQINHMHTHRIIAEDALEDLRSLTYLIATNNSALR